MATTIRDVAEALGDLSIAVSNFSHGGRANLFGGARKVSNFHQFVRTASNRHFRPVCHFSDSGKAALPIAFPLGAINTLLAQIEGNLTVPSPSQTRAANVVEIPRHDPHLGVEVNPSCNEKHLH
jgi:hypothetical protein